MLTRVYIDNFRGFQNFEYKPEKKQLLLGFELAEGKIRFFPSASESVTVPLQTDRSTLPLSVLST